MVREYFGMEDLDTEADVDEILISLVEDKALLYDKSSAQYKDNQKKNEAWIDIASRMFIMTEKPTEGIIFMVFQCKLVIIFLRNI